METIELYESKRYYRRGVDLTVGQVDRRMERFRESLGDWLHGALNWPEADWEADLSRFLEYARYLGFNIEPESQAELRALLAARASESGLFSDLSRERRSTEKRQVQLAAITVDGQQDTDADVNHSEPEQGETEEETAGPGPAVRLDFRQKVQLILEVLDPAIARLWSQHQGKIRSRPYHWYDFFFSYHITTIDKCPAIIVEEQLTAQDVAVAILDAAYDSRTNPIRTLFLEKTLLTAKKIEQRYAELQTEAFNQAAGEAAQIAEMYVGAIGSLTTAGDVVVTLDDIERNGLSWSHLIIALPMMAYLRKGIKRLLVKLPDGKVFQVSGKLLEQLSKLAPGRRKELVAKAHAAKSKEEALSIIEQELRGASSSKRPSPVSRSAPSEKAKPAPGKTDVYVSIKKPNEVQYVGITDRFARRAAEHLRSKQSLRIESLLTKISRSDARAVEQALIEIHGLMKNGGTLLNKINSISKRNPSYAKQLTRGLDLLKSIGYVE